MRFIEHGVMLEAVEWKDGDGRWDCIVRSAAAAMAYGKYQLLGSCLELCDEKERWPIGLGSPSKKMTRDPYIMTICAEYLMRHKPEPFDASDTANIKIPFFSGGRMLYRPHVWAWRKYLITGKEKYKKRYEFFAKWGMKLMKYHNYALVLEAWMAYVADSYKVKDELIDHIPEWNHLLWILVDLPENGDVLTYKPKERNQWTEAEWRDTGYYDGPYTIDKDILTFLLER